jgi:hypothetical protein
MCGKGNERHKAGMVNQVWYTEAALLRTKVAGEVYFLDKGLFMGTTWKQAVQSKKRKVVWAKKKSMENTCTVL